MPKTFTVILLLLRDLKSMHDGFFVSLGFKLYKFWKLLFKVLFASYPVLCEFASY